MTPVSHRHTTNRHHRLRFRVCACMSAYVKTHTIFLGLVIVLFRKTCFKMANSKKLPDTSTAYDIIKRKVQICDNISGKYVQYFQELSF